MGKNQRAEVERIAKLLFGRVPNPGSLARLIMYTNQARAEVAKYVRKGEPCEKLKNSVTIRELAIAQSLPSDITLDGHIAAFEGQKYQGLF